MCFCKRGTNYSFNYIVPCFTAIYDITKDNAKFIYRMCQVRNAESVSHYLLRIFSKEEKKEIVKVYLKSSDVDMDDVVDNIESKLQSIYDEKEFSMIDAIENL